MTCPRCAEPGHTIIGLRLNTAPHPRICLASMRTTLDRTLDLVKLAADRGMTEAADYLQQRAKDTR